MKYIALPKAFYELEAQAHQVSTEAHRHYQLILSIEKAKKENPKLSIDTICKIKEIPRANYYRYKKNFNESGLEPQSKRPIHCRASSLTEEQKEKILEVREDLYRAGKYKIHTILSKYGLIISPSIIGRYIKVAKEKGLIHETNAPTPKKPKKLSGHRQRKPKGLVAENPGELVQIDHAEIQHLPGRKYYHFSAQDPVSRISGFKIYSCATSNSAKDFLLHIQKLFPFPLKSIQVDGGSEFMSNFEEKCKDDVIPLYVLPPKSPKLNGKVERLQRSCREEFYSRYKGVNLKEIREELSDYENLYNTYRPHTALDYLTPFEYYKKLQESEAFLSHM